MKKAGVLPMLFVVVLLPFAGRAEAEQAKKVPRIGYLATSATSARIEAFRQGLRELGYVEGKNSSLSIDTQREKRIASVSLRRS